MAEGRTLTKDSKFFLNLLMHLLGDFRARKGQGELLEEQLGVFRDRQALCIISFLRSRILVPKTGRSESLLPCVVQINRRGRFCRVICTTYQVKPFHDKSRQLLRFQSLKVQSISPDRATPFSALVFAFFGQTRETNQDHWVRT